jgi:Alr-MurF fusion protein
MNYTLRQIVDISGCKVIGNADAPLCIDTLLTDSRSLAYPDSTVFFAIRTPHGDGHRYIKELYDAGVRAFVCDSQYATLESMPQATFLVSDSPLATLQTIACYHRKTSYNTSVVGITGSNGKTVVKEWLYQLIGDKQNTVRSPKSYNSQIGVPLSLTLIQPDTELAIIEAGISKPGEMSSLVSMIVPDIAVITNIGSAHQENFSSLEQKALEKLQLAKNAKKIVFPADDAVIMKAINSQNIEGDKLYGWSADGTSSCACVHVDKIVCQDGRTEMTLKLSNETVVTFTIPFIDNASIQNSITSFVTALAMGYDPKELVERMNKLEPVAMRLEVKEGQRGLTLINDSYNSDINSLDIAIDFMSRRNQDATQKRVLILSDILQGAHDKKHLYETVASQIEKHKIDYLIGVGADLNKYSSLFKTPHANYQSTNLLVTSGELSKLHDATVLIKGARPFHFDRLTAYLEKRVHETILEVNLNAIVDNLNHYRSMMKPTEKIVCMVKASAYGAGSIEISKTLQDHKVDYLAVAVADEGVALRQGGIRSHIMIMNPEMTSFRDLFQFNLEPEVYSFKLLDSLIKVANRSSITNFPIHIKLDTGMHRLGFDPVRDIDKLIDILKHQTALKPCSVFSHFVGSDSDQFDDYTRHQFELYNKASLKLQSAFSHHIIRHICNSAAIERFPEYHLDMVRLGIGLYGINPFDNSVINTISTLKTTILQIRDVTQEDTVGYSRRGVLTRPSRIAAIPIGYADGLDRHLGRGNGYCLVNGKKASYVGNICMDVCMIDVTDIDCKEGDSVEIFGPELPVTVLSEILDTIPYEILTSVSDRVKRVYFS